MNKKAQFPVQQILGVIVLIAILGALGAVFTPLFNQNCPTCQTCDYSSYQNQLDICNNKLNQTNLELLNRPVIYVNQTVEIPINKTIEKLVYKYNPTSVMIIVLSLAISISLTLLSFKIKLPEKLEKELEQIENTIKIIKLGSLFLTAPIFIKLLFILGA